MPTDCFDQKSLKLLISKENLSMFVISMIRADSVVGAFLARRLVESGARFVEVTTEYVPFLNSDTHAEGHSTTEGLHAEIDQLPHVSCDSSKRLLRDRLKTSNLRHCIR